MADKLSSATDETGATPSVSPADEKSPHDFLQLDLGALNEQELQSRAVRRFLMAEVERLQKECVDLRKIRDSFWNQNAELSALRERMRGMRAFELLAVAAETVGAAGLGAAVSIVIATPEDGTGWVFLVLSSILLAAGIFARVIK